MENQQRETESSPWEMGLARVVWGCGICMSQPWVGTFPLPGHSRVGKLNPYISDGNFSVPEVGVEDVGQWD